MMDKEWSDMTPAEKQDAIRRNEEEPLWFEVLIFLWGLAWWICLGYWRERRRLRGDSD